MMDMKEYIVREDRGKLLLYTLLNRPVLGRKLPLRGTT